MNKNLLISLVVAPLMLASSLANANTYGFSNITNNGSVNVASQLSLDVTQSGSNVLFKISNNGSIESVIKEIYFDFGSTSYFTDYSGIAWSASDSTTWNSSSETGVLLTDQNSGGNLGGSVSFDVDDWAKTSNEGPKKGVGLGEYAGFIGTFNDTGGGTFDLLINALNSGDFRIGLHVIAIKGDYSDKFISTPPSPVPLPAAAWLFGSALLGFVSFSKRRKDTN